MVKSMGSLQDLWLGGGTLTLTRLEFADSLCYARTTQTSQQ